MINPMGSFNDVPLKYFGEWTDSIANGALPPDKPPRPAGVERNLVVTIWDWSTDKKYLHDLISTDKRNPTVNAYGKLYGSDEYSSDHLPVLDPKTAKVDFHHAAGGPERARGARAGTCRRGEADRAFGLLGHGADLGHAGQQSQRHVRFQRQAVADRDQSCARHAGLLPRWLG